MSRKFRVAVCGATGAVGREMLKTLKDRNFPVSEVGAFASARSAGNAVPFGDDEITVQELTHDCFEGWDIAIFSAGGGPSREFAPSAVKAGCVVIDNSNAWRMDPACPLVVPEVNPDDLAWHKGIIANPNCSTIQMVVVLKPIHDEAGIERVVVSTYQAVSGTGQKAIRELETQVSELMNGRDPSIKVYPHQIAFNCLPQIDVFQDNGSTLEEMKMARETAKILDDPSVKLTATAVRVPVFYSHSEAVNIQTRMPLSPQACRVLLAESPGITVVDYPEKLAYPMAIDAAGEDDVFVGRIRQDETVEHGLNLWIVSDNIRKGAALNAVQIAEVLAERDLVRVP